MVLAFRDKQINISGAFSTLIIWLLRRI